MSGIPGSVDLEDDVPGTSSPDDTDVRSQTGTKLTVPGNILGWIDDAARQFGLPRDLLVAVVYQHSRFSGLTPGLVAQVAAEIGDRYHEDTDITESEQARWLDAAAFFAYGNVSSEIAQAYRGNIARVYGPEETTANPAWKPSSPSSVPKFVTRRATGITLGPDASLPSGKFTTARFPGGIGGKAAYGPGGTGSAKIAGPIVPGLTDEEAIGAQRVADSLYLQYFGRFPTPQEYRDVVKGGFTPTSLEEHLRAQPYSGTTRGQWEDAKAIANRYAQQQFGRDAAAEEINFVISNGISGQDNISAYYEQLRQRRDTGDPSFAWVSDPTTWRDTQSLVDSLWKKSGLTGIVDPHFVNQAVQGKWGQDEIQRAIDAMPAPGYAEGVTVGAVNRMKPIAQGYKDSISHIHQGEPVSTAELASFIGGNMNPMGIREYYRSLPAGGRGTPPEASTSDTPKPPEAKPTTMPQLQNAPKTNASGVVG